MDKILILDFGSQVTQLIARRIRKKKIYCEIHPFNISKKKIENFSPKALILSGGPASTTTKTSLSKKVKRVHRLPSEDRNSPGIGYEEPDIDIVDFITVSFHLKQSVYYEDNDIIGGIDM